jgi:predicted nucleic acid-binding protein
MNGTKYLLDTNIITWNVPFRRRHHIKLPDSIIAATAKAYQVELLTLDKNLANKLKLSMIN